MLSGKLGVSLFQLEKNSKASGCFGIQKRTRTFGPFRTIRSNPTYFGLFVSLCTGRIPPMETRPEYMSLLR